jgi:Raf kinase inhibitor-like YbhB/YbcL family protein
MQLTSTDFGNGDRLPERFASTADNMSPELSWTDVPPGTRSLVLILDDPDAPGRSFIHWIVYDIPVSIDHLDQAIDKNGILPAVGRAKQGRNDMHKIGYDGPAPPKGQLHHYYFKLYALDKAVNLEPGTSVEEVRRAMNGHILAEAELIGTYEVGVRVA